MTNIKFFFITLCSFYLFKKLLKIQTSSSMRSLDFAISFALTVIMAFSRHYIGAGGIFTSAVLFCLICRLRYQQPTTVSFVAGIVAYGLSYVALYGAVVMLFPITFFSAWLPIPGKYIEYAALFLAGLVQLLLVKILFRHGRFVNGMPYLREGHAGWFGAAISLILLLASSVLFAHPGEDVRILLYIILAAESGFSLFAWWYSKLVKRYFEKIKDRQIEQLHTDVQQLESDKSAILIDNMELAKIIHTDSKVVPAMGTMLKEILNTAEFPDEENKAKAAEFLEYLDRSMKERTGQFFEYHNKSRELPQTGDPGIDSMVRHMAARAYAQGINFQFVCPASVKHLTHDTISAGDLAKIIGDLIENAIIAERDCEIREIFLSIQVKDSCYALDIADTGTAFDSAVIEKLGTEPVTTHADTGGSGLGLLAILETTRKVNASFVLDDALNERPFSKRISICFDGLGQIRIKTSRSEIRRLRAVREDVKWL